MENRFRFGEFVLDVDRRELTRALRQVRLEPKHFAMLELLVRAAPTAVSKREIYETLWPDVVVEEANVHNLASELRRILEDTDRSLIRTVHGFGYAFAGLVDTTSRWELIVGEQHRFRLFLGANVIGRDEAADVILDYPGISRRHAVIRATVDGIVVEDLGSKNGTFVGGTPVTGPTPARSGDSLLFSQVAALLRHKRSEDPTLTE